MNTIASKLSRKIEVKALIIILLFSSCQIKYSEIEVNLKYIIEHYKKEKVLNQKIYIVTGLDGCGLCKDYTVAFIEKNIMNQDFTFIVSGSSKVKMKNTFLSSTTLKSNFIQDTLSLGLHKNLANEHPKAYLCKQGKIIDFKEITFINADSIFKELIVFSKTNP